MEWSEILMYAIPIIMLVVEYYLGKTDKVEASSTLELIEKLLRLIASFFKK